MNKVNKVLGAISCTIGLGIAGAIMVGAFQSTQATASTKSGISRIERIVEGADIRFRGVYVLCHDGHEFLITAAGDITVTQVMVDGNYGLDPKEC